MTRDEAYLAQVLGRFLMLIPEDDTAPVEFECRGCRVRMAVGMPNHRCKPEDLH